MKIGNDLIIFNETILVPDGDSAEFTAVIDESNSIKIKLIFISDGAEPGINWEGKGGAVVFTFKNWNKVTGTAVKDPMDIGTFQEKRRILGYALHTKVGNINQIHFQVTLEGETNE